METSCREQNGDIVSTLFFVDAIWKEDRKVQNVLNQMVFGGGKYIERQDVAAKEELEVLPREQQRSCLCLHRCLGDIVQSRHM